MDDSDTVGKGGGERIESFGSFQTLFTLLDSFSILARMNFAMGLRNRH